MDDFPARVFYFYIALRAMANGDIFMAFYFTHIMNNWTEHTTLTIVINTLLNG